MKHNRLIKFVLVFLIGLFYQSGSGQDTSWQINPRVYVTNMAIEASNTQIAVQNDIKLIQQKIVSSKQELKTTKIETEIAKLKKEIVVSNTELNNLKTSLKQKITISKKYKKLLTLTDEDLKKALAKEFKTNHASDKIVDKNKDSIVRKKWNSEAEEKKAEVSNRSETIGITKTDESNLDIKDECSFQKLGDSKKIALEPELLFTYTPEELKKHLKGLPYSKGWAFLAIEPGYLLLQLNMEISSEQALEYYGNMGKSFITLKLVNGKEVRLINSGFDSGQIDKFRKLSLISGVFNIDKASEKILASSELDTIKFNLVSGYELYTIYNVDFFTRQLNCINSAK